LNGKSFRIQRILQSAIGLPSLPIYATRTYGHTHFFCYEEVQKWVDKWIASKDTVLYHRGIALLPERWEKVVENGRNYFD